MPTGRRLNLDQEDTAKVIRALQNGQLEQRLLDRLTVPFDNPNALPTWSIVIFPWTPRP